MQVPSGFKRLSPGMYRAPTGELMQRGAGGAMTVSPRSGVKPQASFQMGSAVRPQPLPPAPTGFKPLMPPMGSAAGYQQSAQQYQQPSASPQFDLSQDPSYQRWQAQQSQGLQQPMLNLQGQGYGQQAMQGVAQGQPLAQDRSGLMAALQRTGGY